MNRYAACWIRLIMAMVYNSHQMYQNLQTYNHLMDKENCLTFKSFSLSKAKSGSFRSFCQKAANSINQVSGADGDESDSSGNNNNNDEAGEGLAYASSGKQKYNKRGVYFQDPAKIKIRLDKSLGHKKQSIRGKRKTCVYCCCKKHDDMTEQHSRLGHKTSFECGTCQVPLCYVPRSGEDSCAKLFHERKVANDPCDIGTEVRVRSHSNRVDPPSRKRQADDQPNTHRKHVCPKSKRNSILLS
jgi:ferredoxin-like protein FixX